jgi:hypothetical protein
MLGLGAITVLALALLGAQYARWMDGYVTDDAFISFRYAQNLADGLGPVWSPGVDPVEGYTNFGWVLLMAAAIKLGIDPLDASRALGVLATAGTLSLVPLLAAQIKDAWSWRWWAIVASTCIALGLNSGLSIWTFAGLETSAHGFLVLAALTTHLWEERGERRPLWSAPLFLLAALMRPDAVIFWGLAALHKTMRLWEAEERRDRLGALAVWAGLFLVPLGAYWVWRWSYYGYFFPNTYYVKTERSVDFFQRGWNYGADFVVIYWGWIVLAGVASLWRERRQTFQPATFLFAVTIVWFLYVVYSGGDWMPYFRFFVPILPLVYLLAANGVIDVADMVSERRPRMHTVALLVTAGALGLVAFSAVRPHDDATAKQSNSGLPTLAAGLPGAVRLGEAESIGRWLGETFPPETTIAQIATGVIPYYSRLPTLDMLGVNDEHIAHVDTPLGRAPAGHEKVDGAYIISQQPELIWLMLGPEAVSRTSVEDYMPPNWPRGFLISDSILLNGYVWDLYEPLSVPYEGGGYVNFLVHKSAELPRAGELLIPLAGPD